MNDFWATITAPNTKKYPLHRHKHWEIMYYLKGTGYLANENKDIPFDKGTIIIVPPNTEHGSVSQEEFTNISVGGDFGNLFMFDTITVIQDNLSFEGEQLATLIHKNRYQSNDYLSSLCCAYAHFLLQNCIYEKKINRVIGEIIDELSKRFYDPELNVTAVLNQSGYAEDYIRNEFKKTTALTPVEFLTKIRVNHAQKLFEIYGSALSVCEVAESCGFNDAVYFSKRFKQFTGVSPTTYIKAKAR